MLQAILCERRYINSTLLGRRSKDGEQFDFSLRPCSRDAIDILMVPRKGNVPVSKHPSHLRQVKLVKTGPSGQLRTDYS